MRKIYQILLAAAILTGISFSSFAQKSFFTAINEADAKVKAVGKAVFSPQKFSTVKLDVAGLKTFLWSLPSEKNINITTAPVLEIPMPDGKLAAFHVWQSSVQEPGLEAKFPEIKTFAGQGIDDPTASVRFDYTDFGFHAAILSPNGRVYIDPFRRGDVNYYMSYYTVDNARYMPWECTTKADPQQGSANRPGQTEAGFCRGDFLITYRLAVACTGEYAQAVGGTTPALLHSAIVTSVNRVVGVYISDLSMKMVLVANNTDIEFLDPNTDPFTGNNNGGTLINESQTQIDAIIGTANYDMGHTFSTGGGGLAGLGVICRAGQKARGVTGLPFPVGDNYDIDYVAHEMGHQTGCNHTFNSNMGSCQGNRSAAHAYEVGSGTSIMAYAGICGTDDTQPHSDPYFHPGSFDEASTYLNGTGGTCGVITATGNSIPVITSMSNNGVSIPINTPFTLTGTATDADGDVITYDWEEWDLGPTTVWNGGNANTTSPLFKARIPKLIGSRTFPDIAVILAGYPANPAATMGGLKGETLPTTARALKFRLEVRDNKATGGGIVTGGNGCGTFSGTFQINTIATTGPFAVTVPNGGESYAGGSTQTVTWNVVGTDVAPISTANVKISFSNDGGLTYPTVLLASTANDGTEAVIMPATATTTARIKVEAIGNIFFDISNANFTITSAPTTDFALGASAASTSACPAGTPTVTIPVTVTGTPGPVTFAATAGVPAGATVTFAPNPLTGAGNTVATLNNASTVPAGTYNITVTGTAGTITHTTTITFVITAGTPPNVGTVANQTVCAPAAATFTVSSTTPGATYQWQVSTAGVGGPYTNVTTGTGGTTNTYNTGATTAAMNGYAYHVIVSTFCGGSVSSNNATLTVNTAAAITSGPTPATQSVCTGNTATFTVAATGTGVTYRWQSSPTGAAGTFVNVSTGTGANTNTYTTGAITAASDAFYRVIVTTTTCAGTVTSSTATITISTTTAIAAAGQPNSQTVCAPAAATFTVTATGTGNTYQWQVSTTGVGGPYTNVTTGTGGTTNSYNTGATTAAMSGYAYHVVVTGQCNTVTSNNVTLTVNTAAAIAAASQPAAQTVCSGTTATFTVTATGTGATYQWQVSTTGAGGPYTNVTTGTGGTTNTYTTAVTAPAMNGYYYHVVVTTTACPGTVTSNNVLLTVNTTATINTQPADQSACVPGTATFTVAASGTGLSYQWQVSTDGGTTYNNVTTGTGGTTNTYTTPAVTVAMNGYKYRVLVYSTCSPATPITSNAATLSVNNPVSVTANPQPQRGCAGDTYTFSVTANPATGVSYQWQVSTNGGATYTNIPGATSPTYVITNAPIGLSGNLYRVIVSGGTCGQVITPGALLTLGVKPTVVITAATASTINPSLVTGLNSTVSPPGNYVYSWRRNGALVPNTLATTYLPLTVDNFGSYQLTVFDVATGCSAVSNTVVIDSLVSGHLFIYPNPVTTTMQVRYYSADPAAHNTMLTVYDGKGARVSAKEYTITGTYGRMDVDMSRMTDGVYMVELRDGSGRKLASAPVIKGH